MKYLLSFFVGILLLATPVMAGQSSAQWWACNQMGVAEKRPVFLATAPRVLPHVRISDVEKIFTKKIELVNKRVEPEHRFEPAFDATCRVFRSGFEARTFVSESIKQAKKRGFVVVWLDFDGKVN